MKQILAVAYAIALLFASQCPTLAHHEACHEVPCSSAVLDSSQDSAAPSDSLEASVRRVAAAFRTTPGEEFTKLADIVEALANGARGITFVHEELDNGAFYTNAHSQALLAQLVDVIITANRVAQEWFMAHVPTPEVCDLVTERWPREAGKLDVCQLHYAAWQVYVSDVANPLADELARLRRKL